MKFPPSALFVRYIFDKKPYTTSSNISQEISTKSFQSASHPVSRFRKKRKSFSQSGGKTVYQEIYHQEPRSLTGDGGRSAFRHGKEQYHGEEKHRRAEFKKPLICLLQFSCIMRSMPSPTENTTAASWQSCIGSRIWSLS